MTLPWNHDFPHAAYFTDTSTLVAHKAFRPAKRGDLDAAHEVVADLADWDSMDHLGSCTRPHAIAAVLSPEEGENQLPSALAEVISARYNIPILPIRKQAQARRTKASALDRFCHRPKFETMDTINDIPRMARVIMLDDVITTGGSLSELRLFLWDKDLWAVGAAVIASTPSRVRRNDGAQLAPDHETLRRLTAKHPNAGSFLAESGIYDGQIGCLTEAEACALLAMTSLHGVPSEAS